MANGAEASGGVDLAALGSIESELGLDSLRELIELFLSDTAKQLDAARAAAAAGQADKVKAAAHRLKSMSYYLGARAVHSLCESIEAAVREGRPLDLVAEVGRLETVFEMARPQLEAFAARTG